MHPANVPNGKAIINQLGKLNDDKIKKSEKSAPLSITSLIILKD